MQNRAVADKLLDIAEHSYCNIAERWYTAVHTSPRTISYHTITKDRLIKRAESVFKNLKRMYFAEDSYDEVRRFLEKTSYIEDTMADGIPLCEAVYALVMMRRHLWLYAEMQAIFNTSVDMYQAIQSINRTILVFDYATHIMIEKYSKKK